MEVRGEQHRLVVSGTLPPSAAGVRVGLTSNGRALRAVNPQAGGDRGIHFSIPASIITLPKQFSLGLTAQARDGESLPVATVSGRHQFAVPLDSEVLRPTFVNGLPRSGTTFLMRLLAGHPGVACTRQYPYEHRHLVYWLHSLTVMAGPPDAEVRPVGPQAMGTSEQWTGPNPYFSRVPPGYPVLGQEYVQQLARVFMKTADDVYRQIGGEHAKVLLEKFCRPTLIELARNLYPSMREVVTIRDPRDVVCSMVALNRKRGNEKFGARRARSVSEMLGLWTRRAVSELEGYICRWRPEQRIVVRYEELVADPPTQLTRVLQQCGLDSSRELVGRLVKEGLADLTLRQMHATAGSAAMSVGRWRNEIDPVLLKPFTDDLAEYEKLARSIETA